MSFNSLLRQSITISNPSGTADLHGKDSFSAGQAVRCRFERVYKTVVTAEREREPIHGVAIIGPGFTPQVGAKVQYGSDIYRLLERSDAPGRNGALHHYELMLQLWEFGA